MIACLNDQYTMSRFQALLILFDCILQMMLSLTTRNTRVVLSSPILNFKRNTLSRRLFFVCLMGAGLLFAATPPFTATTCEGVYRLHLQGFCTNQRDAIYWSWTDALVKTDIGGKVRITRAVASHHGDLCYHNGKIYVAVNLGKFNEPAGKEDSWVYVYDATTLYEVARHRVPELVHGAGGIAYHDGKFIVVGGLPTGATENYVYEYDQAFHFRKRHVLASGYTLKGIQTVTWNHGSWWFGCYGNPSILLRADSNFQFNGRWEFNASVGIERLDERRFLIGVNRKSDAGHVGYLVIAEPDENRGLVVKP